MTKSDGEMNLPHAIVFQCGRLFSSERGGLRGPWRPLATEGDAAGKTHGLDCGEAQ
jgi:hypothetical protein